MTISEKQQNNVLIETSPQSFKKIPDENDVIGSGVDADDRPLNGLQTRTAVSTTAGHFHQVRILILTFCITINFRMIRTSTIYIKLNLTLFLLL